MVISAQLHKISFSLPWASHSSVSSPSPLGIPGRMFPQTQHLILFRFPTNVCCGCNKSHRMSSLLFCNISMTHPKVWLVCKKRTLSLLQVLLIYFNLWHSKRDILSARTRFDFNLPNGSSSPVSEYFTGLTKVIRLCWNCQDFDYEEQKEKGTGWGRGEGGIVAWFPSIRFSCNWTPGEALIVTIKCGITSNRI